MSTKREPLLSDEEMERASWDENAAGERNFWNDPMSGEEVREFYEAARAKDAELIQRLVDALRDVQELLDAIGTPSCLCGGIGSMLESVAGNALDAASEHGFKPRQLLKDF